MKKKIAETRGDLVFDWIVTVIVILIALTALYPLYFVLIASISDPIKAINGQVSLIPVNVQFEGYKYIFKDTTLWRSYLNTIIYTTCGTLFALFMTILGGYALSRRDLIGGGWLMRIYIFTMYFSGGLIPTYLVVKGLGLINTPFVMMILGSFSVFNLIVTRTFFMTKIPYEFLEAAGIDGCGNGRFFLYIALPLSKEVVAIIALFYAVAHWNSYFNALIYLTNRELYPLQLVLRSILVGSQSARVTSDFAPEELYEMQRISLIIKYGLIVVASLPVMLVYPFIQRYFVKGVMIGGIKG